MPRPVGGAAAELVARVVASRSPARRAIVARNLRRVVGSQVNAVELQRLVTRAFVSYGRYWAEAATLDAGRARPWGRGLTVDGREHLERARDAGRGAVVVLPHLGSWEIGAVWAAHEGFPLTTVAEPVEPPELFAWLVAEREALGLRVLPLGGDAAHELLATLRRGGFVALLADRDLVGDGVDVELFGERTKIPAGPAALALRSGATLLCCAIYMGPHGTHELVVRPPLEVERRARLREDVTRLTQDVAHELEALVRRAPEQWHVFQPNWPSDVAVPATRATGAGGPRGRTGGPTGVGGP